MITRDTCVFNELSVLVVEKCLLAVPEKLPEITILKQVHDKPRAGGVEFRFYLLMKSYWCHYTGSEVVAFNQGDDVVFELDVVLPLRASQDNVTLKLSPNKELHISSPNLTAVYKNKELVINGLLNISINLSSESLR